MCCIDWLEWDEIFVKATRTTSALGADAVEVDVEVDVDVDVDVDTEAEFASSIWLSQ